MARLLCAALVALLLSTSPSTAQTPLPVVYVLSTGGTIAGQGSSSTDLSNYKPGTILGEQLVKAVPQIAALLQGFDANTHARGMGLRWPQGSLPDFSRLSAVARAMDGSYTSGVIEASVEAALQRELIRMKEREAQRIARLRVTCGAKTTLKGTSCRNKSEPGRNALVDVLIIFELPPPPTTSALM